MRKIVYTEAKRPNDYCEAQGGILNHQICTSISYHTFDGSIATPEIADDNDGQNDDDYGWDHRDDEV